MKKRILGGLLAAMLLLGVLAPAAAASTSGAGAFIGTATVGKWFTTGNPCDKSGDADVAGPGLWLPGTPQDLARRAEGVWALSTRFDMVGASQGTTGAYAGFFDVCGYLESMVDAAGQEVGASCGPSKGFHGKGRARSDDGLLDIKLYNIGWKAVVGNVIPVYGEYQDYLIGSGQKGKKGIVYAIVMANPDDASPTDCVDGPYGEQEFDITGTFDLTNAENDKGKPNDDVLRDKQCKGDGPDNKDGPKPNPVPCKTPGPQKPKP